MHRACARHGIASETRVKTDARDRGGRTAPARYRGLQSETERAEQNRHIRWRMCEVAHGHHRSGREWQEVVEDCDQQRLTGWLVLNDLQLAEQRRVVVAKLQAANGLGCTVIVPDTHRHTCHLSFISRSRQAGTGDTREERKQPRPENQGRERFAMAAYIHSKSITSSDSLATPSQMLLTYINGAA